MARDDQYKTSHASPGYKNDNSNGDHGHSNGEHRKDVGNDEGWLSDFLGKRLASVISRPNPTCLLSSLT